MIIGILKESGSENRVAMLPGEAASLRKMGVDVLIETGAGKRAFASDGEYKAVGIEPSSRKDILSKAALILSVNPSPRRT